MEEIKREFINPQPDGGAPIYLSDLLQIQENARNGYSAFFQDMVNKSGTTVQVGFLGPIAEYKNGVWVITPTITQITPNSHEVSEGWFFCDGRLVRFPGGTYDLSAPNGEYKGIIIGVNPISTKEARVFKDGFSKEEIETYSHVEYSTYKSTQTGWVIPNTLDQSKQFVLISQENEAEPNIKTVLGVNSLESRVTSLEVNLETPWQNMGPNWNNLFYKRGKDGTVYLSGEAVLPDQGGSFPVSLFTLPQGFRPSRTVQISSVTRFNDGTFEGGTVNTTGEIIVSGENQAGIMKFGGISFPTT